MGKDNGVSVINVEGKVSPQNTIETALAAYEEKQKAITDRREEYSIGMVTDSYERLSLTYLWRPVGGILFSLLVILAGVVVLPQHNVFKEPEYWWECLSIQCNVVWINTSAMFFISTANILINLEGVYTFKHYLITWVVSVAFYSASWAVTYAIWTPLLGFRYPIPFVGIVNAVLGLSSQVFATWFLFPKAIMTDAIKKRVKFLIANFFFVINVSIAYWILWWLFSNVPLDYQWAVVLLLPVVREAFGWFICFLGLFSKLFPSSL